MAFLASAGNHLDKISDIGWLHEGSGAQSGHVVAISASKEENADVVPLLRPLPLSAWHSGAGLWLVELFRRAHQALQHQLGATVKRWAACVARGDATPCGRHSAAAQRARRGAPSFR